MESLTEKLNKISLSDLQQYYETEKLVTLHSLKLYLDDIYYNTDKSSLEDNRYDMLKDTLQRKDPGYTPPVGVKIREGENKVKLPFWLGSMDKMKPDNELEIKNWIGKYQNTNYLISDKLDGVSCLVIITNGKLKLYTRGDGTVGSDISYLAQYINYIPSDTSINIIVRGELIISKRKFKEYENIFANARNMVSGLVNAKTIRKGLNDVDFIAYEIVGDGYLSKPSEQFKIMEKLGLKVVRHKIIDKISPTILSDVLTLFKKNSEYEIDGVIIQVDSNYYRNTSGNPEYAFAFKMTFGDNVAETEVEYVEWNITKHGLIKPRIKVKPVKLSGVTINYTSGFNAKYIVENNIGPGAIVKITRSGDVIPYILDIVKKAEEPQMPDIISYKWNKTNVDIIAIDAGKPMCIKIIVNFFTTLKIKNISEATVEKLLENGFNTLLKILQAKQNDFLVVPTFKEKMAKRIYENIHNGLKNVSMGDLMSASGLFGFGFGRKRAKLLLLDIPNIMDIYDTMSRDELLKMIMNIEGFSLKTATLVVINIDWFAKFLNSIFQIINIKQDIKISDNLKGKKFVVSGFRGIEEDIEKRGGKVVNSVSKNTDGIIVLSKSHVTGKVRKGLELGISIYTKEDFIKKFL